MDMSENRDVDCGMDALFRPKSIAIIGASSDPVKTGGRPVRLLQSSGYPGKIYPINTKADAIQGLSAYPDIGALPEVPDLAIVVLPGQDAVAAVKSCSDRGVPAVILLSAGFAEQGSEGALLQTQLTQLAARTGTRILGPNCLGTVSVPDRVTATFSVALEAGLPVAGPIAIVSQSGNIGSVVMKMLTKGVPASTVSLPPAMNVTSISPMRYRGLPRIRTPM